MFILESLEQAPKHGYALLKEMTESFGAEPNRNRLYPLLARLVKDGYIREVAESGGNRTLYALTDQGRDALHAYRRLPVAFRHALRRIWAVESHAPAEREGERAREREEKVDGEGQLEVATSIPVQAAPPRSRSEDALYPCPDARVAVEKDPTSGDLSLKLTGCPMGSYSYCPECPIWKAVRPFRALVFPP